MRKGDRKMEQLKRQLVAWSKLATTGARPVGERAGFTRETFSRVLSNRRQLQDDEATQLAGVLGFDTKGFKGHRIESNLCRFLSDLEDLGGAGIQLEFIANIRSTKELRGGVALQRYCAVLATIGITHRLMVLRMAVAKHDQLMLELRLPTLPTVEVDTLVLPLLSDISYEIGEEEWKNFVKAKEVASTALKAGYDKSKDPDEVVRAQAVAAMAKWLGAVILQVLKSTEAGQLTGNMARRIRATDLSRVAADHEILASWPALAKEYSSKRLLTPLTNEYSPYQATGRLVNGKPVFVFITVINEEVGLYVPEIVREIGGYVIVFNDPEKEFLEAKALVYEGPVDGLAGVLKDEKLCEDIRHGRGNAIELVKMMAASVREEEKIATRKALT